MKYDDSIEYRLVSFQNNWSFSFIWKNGTNSISNAFANYLNIGENNPNIKIKSRHKIHNLRFILDENSSIRMLHKDSEDYKKFVRQSYNVVCLRDPVNRFLSLFNDKVLRYPNGPESYDFFKKYPVYHLSKFAKLELFISYVQNNIQTVDPHFWSQSRVADLNSIKYSQFIRLDNLKDDWATFCKKFDDVPELPQTRFWSNDSEKLINELKKEKNFKRIVNKITNIYEEDYDFIKENKTKFM